MDDLINREEVLKLPRIKGYATNGWDEHIRVYDIEDLPSADLSSYSDKLYALAYERGKADAQKKGKWIMVQGPVKPYGVCSICDNQEYEPWHFCPNCGADMREGDAE